jgi:phosphoserine phosphatase
MEDPLAVPIPDYAHRVAMYDMDRTITRSGTYSGFLIHVARRRQRWRLLLATASFHLYVDAIARRIGIDDVLATRLDEPDGGDHIHARLSGDNCYGEAKFARINDWLAANAITRDAAHIRAYSDHVSDHPMLRFADEAVATTPSRGLRRLAPRMGWQVVDWRGKR